MKSNALQKTAPPTPSDSRMVALSAQPGYVKQGTKYQGGKPYIPISYIEQDLDDIFTPFGWQTCDFQLAMVGTKQGQNNTFLIFTASITLKVWDENKKCWISREGSASGETSEKQTGTFAPKLKAEAIKNAAKGLGNRLGRNIARKEEDSASSHSSSVALNMELAQFISQLQAEGTIERINAIWQKHPQKENSEYKKAFKSRWQEIKDTTKQDTIGE